MPHKRNLKIAILGTRGIPAKYGGYETVVETISISLAKMGIDITVFCPSDNEYKKNSYNGVKLSFVRNFEKVLGPFGTLLYDFLSVLKSTFSDCNIVYMLGYSSAILCFIPRLFGKKVVINTDGLEWKRSKWSRFAKLYLRFNEFISTRVANVLISDSVGIQKYFKEKFGVNSVYIAYGTDLYYSKSMSVVRNLGLAPHSYYLVVARLEPENNIDKIIKGFSLTKSRKKLLLITNIKKTLYYHRIKNLCDKDKRIIFFGPLYDRNELNEIRANSFAYIHGHSVGGTNPSLLESMSCGNVVISYDAIFNREVTRNSNIYFKDEHELCDEINKLEVLNRSELQKISKKNMFIIKKFYNWDAIVKQHVSLFKSIQGEN